MKIVKKIDDCSFQLIEDILNVEAKRCIQNETQMDVTPQVMFCKLIKMRTWEFVTNILDPYRDCMEQFWSKYYVDITEKKNHKRFFHAYNLEAEVRDQIYKYDHATTFNDLNDRFDYLRRFCGGLTVAFANTRSLEFDFSILRCERYDHCTTSTNLSLEVIFQSK